MFCSECGNAIKPELNFCNRCGAEMPRPSSGSNAVAANLSNVLGAIGVFGMLGFLAVIYLLVSNGFNWAGVTWISFFYLTALGVICHRILGQIAAHSGIRNTTRSIAQVPSELGSVTTGQLHEAREPVASVTDHTTRTLDEARVARK